MAINTDLLKSKLFVEIADFYKSRAFLELKFEKLRNLYRTQTRVVKLLRNW